MAAPGEQGYLSVLIVDVFYHLDGYSRKICWMTIIRNGWWTFLEAMASPQGWKLWFTTYLNPLLPSSQLKKEIRKEKKKSPYAADHDKQVKVGLWTKLENVTIINETELHEFIISYGKVK